MAKLTVLAVAVLCDGKIYQPGTKIEDIPERNRESVRLRYCEDIHVPDSPTDQKPAKPAKPKPPEPPAPPVVPPAPPSAAGNDGPVTDGPLTPPPTGLNLDPSQATTTTPLPEMAEELVTLLKAGGIETVEQATEYFARNKSFRPLKGVGDAKDVEIRKALGL